MERQKLIEEFCEWAGVPVPSKEETERWKFEDEEIMRKVAEGRYACLTGEDAPRLFQEYFKDDEPKRRPGAP